MGEPEMSEAEWKEGLEGVVAARTALTHIDGQAGRLFLCGYEIGELAPAACFEETLHLLWSGRLPTVEECDRLRARLAARRELSTPTRQALEVAAAQRRSPIEALRLGVESLPSVDGDEELRLRLAAGLPAIVAAYWRLQNGQDPVPSDPRRGQADDLLHMLFGRDPSPSHVRALDTYLNTMADHGLNASTFTARIIVSTQSDLTSAVVGALGALKGPIHGGAPGPVLEMLQTIGTPERAELVVRDLLDRGQRVMGFGHREYRVRDPRARILSAAAAEVVGGRGNSLYELARSVEKVAEEALEQTKPGRHLKTNAEFYTAVLLHELGLPAELFTSLFAVSRVSGWIAHALEQAAANRIFRPASRYCGAAPRPWVPLSKRPAA
jgi:citrate synthase